MLAICSYVSGFYLLFVFVFPGVLQIAGAGVFAGEYAKNEISTDWSFGLGVTAGVFLLISGIIYAVTTMNNGCSLKPELPCSGETVQRQTERRLNQNYPYSSRPPQRQITAN